MRHALSITIGVLIAVFGITLSPPAMASTTASCTSLTLYKDAQGVWTQIPTIGWETHRDNCLLGIGNQSVAVERLQWSLRFCYNRSIALDGVFGPQTESALRYAQRAEHISADGVYGPQTRDDLKWFNTNGWCVRL
jgi:peptidoglycan hydrolase-like protein with peptidoglycan-binding domain